MKEIKLNKVNEELEIVKEEIQKEMQQWFPNCYWSGLHLFTSETKHTILNIMVIKGGMYFRNMYSYACRDVDFNHIDVFEEVDNCLTTIKIKKRPFDLEKFKQELCELDENIEESIYYGNDYIVINGYILVGKDGDINFKTWHNGLLEGHYKFKFDDRSVVIIDNQEDANEFKQLVKGYIKVVRKLNVIKGNNEQINL